MLSAELRDRKEQTDKRQLSAMPYSKPDTSSQWIESEEHVCQRQENVIETQDCNECCVRRSCYDYMIGHEMHNRVGITTTGSFLSRLSYVTDYAYHFGMPTITGCERRTTIDWDPCMWIGSAARAIQATGEEDAHETMPKINRNTRPAGMRRRFEGTAPCRAVPKRGKKMRHRPAVPDPPRRQSRP